MSRLWVAIEPLLIGTGLLCWVCAVIFTAIIVASDARIWLARRRRSREMQALRRQLDTGLLTRNEYRQAWEDRYRGPGAYGATPSSIEASR